MPKQGQSVESCIITGFKKQKGDNEFIDGVKKYKPALDNMKFVKFTSVRDNSVFAGVDDSRTAFAAVNRWLVDNNAEFDAIEIVEPSLEDVFLALTGSDENRGEELVC